MTTLHYTISGNAQGPWLTLGHSLATDMRMWEPQLKALEEHFHLLRYDTRGHGNSPAGESTPTMADLVEDVITLWDQLEIRQSHFLGLSLGGMTGAGLALTAPQRVTTLTACDCRLDAPEFFRTMWDQRIAIIESGGMDALVDAIIDTWLCPASRSNQPALETFARRLIVETPVASYIACARAIQTLDYQQRLAELRIPVLYLVGAEDGPHPAAMRELQLATPGAELVELEGAAHLSNLEQAEAFNRAVLAFLLRHRSAA